MSTTLLIAAVCPLLFVAAWTGGRLHARIVNTHLRVQLMLSFVGGLMLGLGLLHLLPHAILVLGSLDAAFVSALVGVVVVFLTMRFFHVHSHDPAVECIDSDTSDGHSHDHAGTHEPGGGGVRWVTLLVGLSLHSVVDGLAVAAAVIIESGHTPVPGLGVLLVVLLHKPIDAIALNATMSSAGAPKSVIRLTNLGFAAITPLAAIIAGFGFAEMGNAAGYAMAFAAGAFICIALADLMPELQFHTHHRPQLTAALIGGIGVSVLLGIFEGGHDHSHDFGHGHDHSGHSHSPDHGPAHDPDHDHDH
ncbi:MAG: ZIP family metal transporter [Planctomycetota bacterium]